MDEKKLEEKIRRIGLNVTDYEYESIKKLISKKRFFNMSDFMRTAIRNELERIKKEK